MQPGMTVSAVAGLHGVSTSLLFGCRRHMGEGGGAAIQADDDVVAAGRLRELEGRVIAPASNLRWSSDGSEIRAGTARSSDWRSPSTPTTAKSWPKSPPPVASGAR